MLFPQFGCWFVAACIDNVLWLCDWKVFVVHSWRTVGWRSFAIHSVKSSVYFVNEKNALHEVMLLLVHCFWNGELEWLWVRRREGECWIFKREEEEKSRNCGMFSFGLGTKWWLSVVTRCWVGWVSVLLIQELPLTGEFDGLRKQFWCRGFMWVYHSCCICLWVYTCVESDSFLWRAQVVVSLSCVARES